jgi:hypothetical protein
MTTTTTSALTKKVQSENIKGQKSTIEQLFKSNPSTSYTYKEIEAQTGIKSCCRRISELLRDGTIMHVGRVKSNNKWLNIYLYASEQHREQLVKAMFMQDLKAWIKQGERFREFVDLKILK